jgi:hypothetical protein
MSDSRQQVFGRTAVGDDPPAHKVRSTAEKDKDLAVSRGTGLETAIHDPAACPLGEKGRRRGSESRKPTRAEANGLGPAAWISARISATDAIGEVWPDTDRIRDLDRPQFPADPQEIILLADLLVPEELGPGPIGSVGEVLNRSLAIPVPPRRRLGLALPQKRESRVGVTEDDHVAGEAVSERASSRRRCSPGASGFQSPWRKSAGALPASRERGLSNQRRIPISL